MLLQRLIISNILGAAFAALPQGDLDATQLLKNIPNLSTLYKAIEAVPGLGAKLDEGNITILAPTNKAFANLEPGTPEANAVKSGNTKDLESLLAYHVVEGLIFYAAYARDGPVVKKVPTFAKTLLTSQDRFDGSAATGVSGGQNVELVEGKADGLVVSGELQTSAVGDADLEGKKVVIHNIDTVLKLPRMPSETADDLGLTAIVGALEATKLAPVVDSAKDLTIFVPANEAFQAIGSIIKGASTKTLKSILEYHVVSGSVVFSTDVKNETVKSYGGKDLMLSVVDDAVFVNTAKVLIPNVITSNGVVHVIDSVLNPADAGSVNRASLNPNSEPKLAFSGASSVKYTPFASSAPKATTTLNVPQIATSAPAVPTAAEAKDASSSSNKKANAADGLNFSPAGILVTVGAAVVGALEL